MASLDWISLAASGLFGVSLLVGVHRLATLPAAPRPALGHRGVRRQAVMGAGGLFCVVEPLIRYLAARVGSMNAERARRALEAAIVQSGNPLGLDTDEAIALSLLTGVGGGALGALLSMALAHGALWVVPGVALGTALPLLRMRALAQRRHLDVNRGLPAAIDLAALCMGAGLDFNGALRMIASRGQGANVAVQDELARLVQELDMGRTRRSALLAFEERIPTPAVRDFVGATIQADEKGNPLADVLRIQAEMLRMRRSVAAEEAASRAGVLMLVPLVLLLGCILLLLFGPFIVNGVGFG